MVYRDILHDCERKRECVQGRSSVWAWNIDIYRDIFFTNALCLKAYIGGKVERFHKWKYHPDKKRQPRLLINIIPPSAALSTTTWFNPSWSVGIDSTRHWQCIKIHAIASYLVNGNVMRVYDDWCCRLDKLTWQGVNLPRASSHAFVNSGKYLVVFPISTGLMLR